MLDQRGRLLRAALGFAALPRPSYDRALWALRTWLDSILETLSTIISFSPAIRRSVRIDTTQTYAQIKPSQLKRAVEFYEGKALDILSR